MGIEVLARHLHPIAVLLPQVGQQELRHGRVWVNDPALRLLRDQVEALGWRVDNLRQPGERNAFEHFFGLGPLQRLRADLHVRVQRRDDLIDEGREHPWQVASKLGGRALDPLEDARALRQRLAHGRFEQVFYPLHLPPLVLNEHPELRVARLAGLRLLIPDDLLGLKEADDQIVNLAGASPYPEHRRAGRAFLAPRPGLREGA